MQKSTGVRPNNYIAKLHRYLQNGVENSAYFDYPA